MSWAPGWAPMTVFPLIMLLVVAVAATVMTRGAGHHLRYAPGELTRAQLEELSREALIDLLTRPL